MNWTYRWVCACALGMLALGYGGAASAQCADGSQDLRLTDTIYGCSGAWNEGGVVDETGAPVVPKCERRSGNTGMLQTTEMMEAAGAQCTAADLCAAGWSLCTDGDTPADGLGCGDATVAGGTIYVAATDSCTIEATPQVVGCGTLGCPADYIDGICSAVNRTSGGDFTNPCETLNRTGCIDGDLVDAGWSCVVAGGTDTPPRTVTKATSQGGGVLCCFRELCDCLDEEGTCYVAGETPEPCVECVAGEMPGVPLTIHAGCGADGGLPEVDAGPVEGADFGPQDFDGGPAVEEISFRGDGGCECRTATGGSSNLAFAVLALAFFARRRRRR